MSVNNQIAVKNYNPDVLSCLANLSNDEVFTPPSLANRVLDQLPTDLWSNPDAKFLDPFTKTGVFLREITKRLNEGLKQKIPDQYERINHILLYQVYGIATTELTSLISRRSLYCSKNASGKYSICGKFDNDAGNIKYDEPSLHPHVWDGKQCVYCGASKEQYDRSSDLESYTYEFLHTYTPESFFNMQFDVIVGNPPYQMSDGGYRVSASPIYQRFVEQAEKLNPRYLTMIIPSRWFAGGKGLDQFRDDMLHDRRIREIHDYPNAMDCFPGVQIKGGVCYFLWDRDNKGDCKVQTITSSGAGREVERPLLEEGSDVFIRWNEAVQILKKVRLLKEPTFESQVSARKPFGLPTTFHGKKSRIDNGIKLYENKGTSWIESSLIRSNRSWIKSNKVFVPEAGSGSDAFPHPIIGKPFFGAPNTVSTETYLLVGPYASQEECENVISYMKTRLFRFLVLLRKPSQHATSKVYGFVPMQDFSVRWSDEELYKKYGISSSEERFIESLIKPMD
ncbi:Eco57I restriction-modification methylase domain-containing protein [Bifidobacterium sp. ESL0704]|uniref:Eco57I restriction-modification methylase domain-containing protein n=1 Tax=Bifidobacterium sp. ESL0704 TaxID=2983219 RepID=UPI0023F9A8AB|nr:Eco57I restriction-modification methylase domain-containing protein [Bifidobacterium sp. ESL0704]WEV52530.1 Eco57I restriction-modification methylase domain-containing protein [Bifidobacterium sp. ESL0704]